ncbi:MAG: hydrogenase nickel incorporation protein HypB [Rhodobacteraceae bacterium]|nr:hydrogenase nickel incorporation protein HypB [Paracoccaceae bacterium]
MCGTCGCGDGDVRIGGHAHQHGRAREIALEIDIMAKNDAYAAANRQRFAEGGILALNLVSSPGSGKTSLLVKTIEMLKGTLPVYVVEGDQQTSHDADRIRETGASAIQINTGKGCHLDAHMVGHAVADLNPARGAALFIENVGNLVCPAGFDLGEAHKVVVLSVTEGEDKPLKYPDMFAAADLALINKADLLPHLQVDMALIAANALKINPGIEIIQISALTGTGMAEWLDWIGSAHARVGSAKHVETAAE